MKGPIVTARGWARERWPSAEITPRAEGGIRITVTQPSIHERKARAKAEKMINRATKAKRQSTKSLRNSNVVFAAESTAVLGTAAVIGKVGFWAIELGLHNYAQGNQTLLMTEAAGVAIPATIYAAKPVYRKAKEQLVKGKKLISLNTARGRIKRNEARNAKLRGKNPTAAELHDQKQQARS